MTNIITRSADGRLTVHDPAIPSKSPGWHVVRVVHDFGGPMRERLVVTNGHAWERSVCVRDIFAESPPHAKLLAHAVRDWFDLPPFPTDDVPVYLGPEIPRVTYRRNLGSPQWDFLELKLHPRGRLDLKWGREQGRWGATPDTFRMEAEFASELGALTGFMLTEWPAVRAALDAVAPEAVA